MTSLLSTWMEDLEDPMKTVPRRSHCDSLDLQHVAQTSTSLLARIEWCREQRMQARTQAELEGWRAEEEGLLDALLGRDHTSHYRYSPPGLFERYAMGLQDGRSLVRLARMDYIWQLATDETHV
jgi:hypothetical protein